MAAIGEFIRGVQFVEIPTGLVPVQITRTSTIGYIGTAPIHKLAEADRKINEPVLIANDRDAARYLGPAIPGYSLPYDAKARDDLGGGLIIAINVFDPATHLNVATQTTAFTGDALTLTGTKPGEANIDLISLEGTANYSGSFRFKGADRDTVSRTFAGTPGTITIPTGATLVSIKSGNTVYELTTDYTIAGETITRVDGGGIAANATVSVTYEEGVDAITLPRRVTKVLAPTANTYDTGEPTAEILSVEGLNGTVYTMTTDYTVAAGVVTRVGGGAIPSGARLRVTYSKVEVETVTSLDGFTTYAETADFTVESGVITRVPTGGIPVNGAIRVAYSEQNVVFEESRDYEINPITGTITRVTTGLQQRIASGATVTASYEYPSEVTSADIIGETLEDGSRTGIQAWLGSTQRLGFQPMLVAAPGWSDRIEVAQALETFAERTRAVAAIDAPMGLTPQEALESRGAAGPAENFFTSSKRIVPCYPHVETFDVATNAPRLEPYSRRWVAMASATDLRFGYWYSPSNKELNGVQGMERLLTSIHNDPNSEVNLLTGAGVATIYRDYATGFVSWGAYSAGYPASAEIENLISVRRTLDVMQFALERACLVYIDQPINTVIVNVPATVNAFLDSQVALGAITWGRCSYDRRKNPPTELAKGILRFDYEVTPMPGAQRIIFEQRVDITRLSTLGA